MADELRKLGILPDQDGYSFIEPESVVFTDTAGGFPRQRLDTPDAPYVVNCVWTLKRREYNYMMRFYRQNLAKPFLADLVIDEVNLKEYTVVFRPQTFRHGGHSGYTYQISAVLIAMPSETQVCLDELMLQLDECYSFKTDCVLKGITDLVNAFGSIL